MLGCPPHVPPALARRSLLIWVFFTLLVPARAELATPEDQQLSPYTGYTRQHWLEITEKLIAGVLPYFDSETGMPDLTGVNEESGHFRQLETDEWPKETFERSLMLVAIYTAATGSDRIDGYRGSIVEPFLRGIARGTDPKDAAYWGPHPEFEIYGTNTAMAILLSPGFFWRPLTPEQQDNVLELMKGLVATVAYDCNHWYFHLMGVPVLEKYGETPDRSAANLIFERLLNWHRGDGWFIDGGNRAFDYYNLWGFQLYNNALCHFDSQWEKMFGDRVRRTTQQFQETFPYLLGRDGSPIPWGRSLTYRFACIAALGYSLLNNTCTLPPGQARRCASGCLKYFWENGCLSKNGLLEPGFHGPNSVVAESYIRRGGPYWAAHGLIPLALPDNHPFWTAVEQPIPSDMDGGRIALKGAEIVLKVSPEDGEARLYPIGSSFGHIGEWQRGIKYFQHSYSSYLGWAALGEGGPDLPAGRTGISFDKVNWHYRTNPEPIQIGPYHCISQYNIDLQGPDPNMTEFGEVVTHSLISTDGEIHVFWHNSARSAFMMIGGYGICIPDSEQCQTSTSAQSILVRGNRNHSFLKVLLGPPGDLKWELLKPREGWAHSHLFGGLGAYPYWVSRTSVPPNIPVVVYVDGTRDRRIRIPRIELQTEPGLLLVDLEGVQYQVALPY